MATFSRFEVGAMDSWDQGSFLHPRTKLMVAGKRFLREPLQLTGMELSLNRMEAGGAMPFLHRHRQNEELYLFLSGQGEFQVDGEVFPVGPGSAVRISPAGARGWRNTAAEPLIYVVIQGVEGSMPGGTVADGQRVEGEVRWLAPSSGAEVT